MSPQQLTIPFGNEIALYSKPTSVEDITNCLQIRNAREGWKRDILAGKIPKKVFNRYILYLMFVGGSLAAIQHYWNNVASLEEKTLYNEARLTLTEEREQELKKLSSMTRSIGASDRRGASRRSRISRLNILKTKGECSNHRILSGAQDTAFAAMNTSDMLTDYASPPDPVTNPPNVPLDWTSFPENWMTFTSPTTAQYCGYGTHCTPGLSLQCPSMYCTYPMIMCSPNDQYPHYLWSDNLSTLASTTPSYEFQNPATLGSTSRSPSTSTTPFSDSDLILNEFGFPSPTGCFDDSDFDEFGDPDSDPASCLSLEYLADLTGVGIS